MIPVTEGIKYAGSKRLLLPAILDMLQGLEVRRVLDGFSGSTRVSQALAQSGYEVTACDLAHYSEVFGRCYLLNTREPGEYRELIRHLNATRGYAGWFTENYGGKAGEKRPFRRENTMKLDGIRDEIDRLGLDEQERAVALSSLMLALDAVDSTLGHFVSYLARWSPRSSGELELKLPHLWVNTARHRVIRGDVLEEVMHSGGFDLAYFDPPYGSNNDRMPPSRVRYASYYHFWTTVVKNDRPRLFGRAGRREDSRDPVAASVFEEFRRNADGRFIALEALETLIRRTDARYILLSYSSGGRATWEALERMLSSCGRVLRTRVIEYRRNVMGSMCSTGKWLTASGTHREYLFLLEKSRTG